VCIRANATPASCSDGANDSCCDPDGFLLHRSRASLRLAQCFSLRDESNTRSTCRFSAPRHTDPRHHCRAVLFGDQDQAFHRCLPFRRFVFCLWQLGDVGPGVLQGDEPVAVRQHNRIVEATLPGHSSTPIVHPDRNIRAVNRCDHRLGCSASGTPIPSGLSFSSVFVLITYGRRKRARNHQIMESLATSGKGGSPDGGCAPAD
jgi:hypothetical protein